MKTTLTISDAVMKRLREESARRGTTMSALVEAGLRCVLDEPAERNKDNLPPLPEWESGGAVVDVSNREELHRVLDADSNRENLQRVQ